MTSPSESTNHPLEARQADNKITLAQREQRNGHRGLVVWLTGLSGAGKTTIATELERKLFQERQHTYLLDGDILRHGLCSDLNFSAESRSENIRRAGEVAALFADSGCIVIAAFISPFRADRERVRRILPPGRFIEVFVNAPLDVCEKRDVKGLYAKARKNQIKEFTGVSAPYEEPEHAEIVLHTDRITVNESVVKILAFLHGQDDDQTSI
ncbi:MAG: adenylyl-sulfate kinase [Akkermansiaceae bacterium]|nr:adenylyl-sulfate kinase [Verrucomicrobiales bacterium]